MHAPADLLLSEDCSDFTRLRDMNNLLLLTPVRTFFFLDHFPTPMSLCNIWSLTKRKALTIQQQVQLVIDSQICLE